MPCFSTKYTAMLSPEMVSFETKGWMLLSNRSFLMPHYLVYEYFLFLVLLFEACGLRLSQYWEDHLMEH